MNVAKDSGLMGKSFTSFREFQIFVAAWLRAEVRSSKTAVGTVD